MIIAMTTSFTLLLSLNTHTYAWHENLGIDDNKASELYHTNPNDPAIVQWKSALQSAINDMSQCFTILMDIYTCQSTYETITSNCQSHPNTLLACNDSRLAQFPLLLQKAQVIADEQQKRAVEEQRKANVGKIQKYALGIIDKCFTNPNSNSTEFYGPPCDSALLSLVRDCQVTSSPYSYCKDDRFVGYLAQHNIILNSTVTPYSNTTGNSSSSNSTHH